MQEKDEYKDGNESDLSVDLADLVIKEKKRINQLKNNENKEQRAKKASHI